MYLTPSLSTEVFLWNLCRPVAGDMCTISQGPPSLNLNLDILDTVVAWSDRSTLLALMLSCRYLNSEASKRLLQHPDLEDYIQIDGKGDQGVMSFVSFMHGTGGDRYCYLRAVTLGGVEISHTVAEKLVDVLRRAKNLKFFSFRDADSSLSLHRDTVPVLNSLRSIEVLKICLAGEHTHRLLENANWPLLSVELHGPYISARELGKRDNTNPMDPFVLLRAARSTLIQLTCINWIEYGEPFRTLPVYVFPRLVKLDIVQFRSPSAAPWVEPFPNVREFTTQTFKWYSLRRGDYAPPDLTWEHDRNATKNARLRDRFWPALDVYNGRTLTDLYLLALPCPIRRVSLATMPNRWTRIFEDAMRHTQVKELKIGHLSPEDLAGDLCACFECAADSLVELHWLCLCLERQEKGTETFDIFTVLVCVPTHPHSRLLNAATARRSLWPTKSRRSRNPHLTNRRQTPEKRLAPKSVALSSCRRR